MNNVVPCIGCLLTLAEVAIFWLKFSAHYQNRIYYQNRITQNLLTIMRRTDFEIRF